jgi:hypothetical protein
MVKTKEKKGLTKGKVFVYLRTQEVCVCFKAKGGIIVILIDPRKR